MYTPYKVPLIKAIKYFGKRLEQKRFPNPPIYIGGCGRSGTTLLLSIISSHPQVFAASKELSMYGEHLVDRGEEPEPKRIDRIYRTMLTDRIDSTCDRWCEKSPRNVRHIEDMDKYHQGRFKFLNIVRDGRDVILSKHPESPGTYWVDPDRWIYDVGAGWAFREHPCVYTLRYEDLILDFENTVEKVCAFLEIEAGGEVLNWHEHTKVRKNKAYFGKVKNIFSSSVGKWKEPAHIGRAKELLQYEEAKKLLEYYGYGLD